MDFVVAEYRAARGLFVIVNSWLSSETHLAGD